MNVALPRFWLFAALALCSATAYSQNDRVLSTQTRPSAPHSLPPIAPIAPIQHYASTLLTPEYQGTRLHISLDQWQSQTALDQEHLATPARQNNLFIILHYRYTNTTQTPVDPRIHQPRLFLADEGGTQIAPNRRATQDYRYAQDLDTVGSDKLNPLLTGSDVAVFEVSPLLFDPEHWSLVVRDGQTVRIPLTVIPEKPAPSAK